MGEYEPLQEIQLKEKNYRIDIGAYGSICVEAPTKEECLELFREVTSTRKDTHLAQAIR